MQKRISISMGDYNGIGPEIILKELSKNILADSTPVVLGSALVFEYYARQLDISLSEIHTVYSPNKIKTGK